MILRCSDADGRPTSNSRFYHAHASVKVTRGRAPADREWTKSCPSSFMPVLPVPVFPPHGPQTALRANR
jgi:hypothetical protein